MGLATPHSKEIKMALKEWDLKTFDNLTNNSSI